MEPIGTLLAAIAWFVGVPLLMFGVLKAVGYDWKKPWLMWRTEAGPLPLWVYLGVAAFIGLGLLVAALTR
ncbi:MAG TPA: hypothetical protein VIR16_10425 [Candidatus Limnocylindrales bacterium]